MKPDILVLYDGGSMVGLRATSPDGRDWIADNCQTEPWRFRGDVLWIDHRLVPKIAIGAADDGLVVRAEE